MHVLESLETCMVDSSYWTIPESESGGCQLGIPEDVFRGQKHKKHYFSDFFHVLKVKDSNDAKQTLFV